MIVKRRKQFGIGSIVGGIWKSGTLGKTAIVGTGLAATGVGLAATGAGVAGAKFAGKSKEALTGNMGED